MKTREPPKKSILYLTEQYLRGRDTFKINQCSNVTVCSGHALWGVGALPHRAFNLVKKYIWYYPCNLS